MQRTGKSYLLNALMGKKAGFTTGQTVNACTQGIWLWGKTIPAKAFTGPINEHADDTTGLRVLFMDTEGLGSTIRSETYNTRIFALALLLSSCFVYNSKGVINRDAIQKLSLVVNLTQQIRLQSKSGGGDASGPVRHSPEDIARFKDEFPDLIWVVRDFNLQLVNSRGQDISSNDYLRDHLQDKPGTDEADLKSNEVRRVLRDYFPMSSCVTMVRPITDEA